MDEKDYVARFLTDVASRELVEVFTRAVDKAEAAQTSTYLAHVVEQLLDDPSVSGQIPESLRTNAHNILREFMLGFDKCGTGELAFKLSALVQPAKQLATEWRAAKVSPTNFLATCLNTSLQLDSVSLQTQETLRAAGLTRHIFVPNTSSDDLLRQDFTFAPLGFGVDLTAKARAGYWSNCPLVGLDTELRTLAKLLNSGTGSVVIVGEPGVGKSAFIQGFAYHIALGDRRFIPLSMDSWTVVMIEPGDVLQGTSGRGDLEARIRDIVTFFRRNPTVIPFLEEVHRLLDTEDSSARSVATALKPSMAAGLFRCVACTTDKEYARFIGSDEAMNSRFRKLILPEPDHDATVAIISGSKTNLLRGRASELGVELSSDAISASVRVTAAHQRSDRLPRKAINLLSAVISERVYQIDMALGVPKIIAGRDVERLFSEISGMPVDSLDERRPAYFSDLSGRLGLRVRGQGGAILAVTSWLSLRASGWVDQRRPRGRFLFIGPPGVGKTELALALAEEVMNDRASVIVVNMADYQGEGARTKFMGADPGYIGFGQTATLYSRVMVRPFSVVLFDEFEKCDPTLSNSLLSVLDGWGADSQGRGVDFSQCIFVLTSNALPNHPYGVARSEAASESGNDLSLDLSAGERGDEHMRQALLDIGGVWNHALLDRIDRICAFEPLSTETMLAILDSLIETRRKIAARPLPQELDNPGTRQAILADAAEEGASSPRRLERSLMRWLSARAARGGVGPGDGLLIP